MAVGADHVSLRQQKRKAAFSGLVSMELAKMTKRPMTRVVFFLTAALNFAGLIVGYAAIQASDYDAASEAMRLASLMVPNMIEDTLGLSHTLGLILMPVLAASIIGSEFSWGTMRAVVGSGVSRIQLLLAKFVTMALLTIAFVVVALGGGVIGSAAISFLPDQAFLAARIDTSLIGDVGLMMLRTIFVLLVPVVMAFTVAVVARSLAAGIAVAIGWTMLEQVALVLAQAIDGATEFLTKVMIITNTQSVLSLNTLDPVSPVQYALNPWQSALLLTGYCLALMVVAVTIFAKRDLACAS